MNKMNLYKEYADEFTEKGLSVIPDKFMMKQPAIKSWTDYCTRKPTPDEIETWKTSFDSSNIAVCLGEASGIIAVDMDSEDPDIAELISRMTLDSPVAKVGSKGWTRFFRYHPTIQTDTLKHNGSVVVEVLANGKKTTLPPSVHPNGETYKWVGKSLVDVSIEDLPLLPPNYIPTMAQMLKTHFAIDQELAYNKLANGRNDALVKYCSDILNARKPLEEAINLLVDYDSKNHDIPLFTDNTEFRHTEPYTNALALYTNCLNSFNSKRYQNNQAYESPVVPIKVDEVEPGKSKSELPENSNNLELPQPAGVLAAIMNWILGNSYIEQPAFAFSAALVLVGTIIGRKFEFEGVAPNLYVLNVGPSGSGKNAPQEKLKEVLIETKLEHFLGAGDYVSDASLMDSLPEAPVRLDIIDEAGGMLRTVNRGGQGYNDKMADILAELYTSSSSLFLGRQTAIGHKGRSIRPNVNLLCSTTPTGLSQGVSTTAIEKGLMGRFIVFKGEYDKKARRIPNPPPLTTEIADILMTLAAYEPEKSDKLIGGFAQNITQLQATEDGGAALDNVFAEFEQLRVDTTNKDNEDVMLPIISRLYQQTLKVAMIHAISRQPYTKPIVTEQDVMFGYHTIKCYYQTMTKTIKGNIHSTSIEKQTMKLLEYISKQDNGVTKKQISQRFRHIKKRERDELLEDLIESGEIDLINVKASNGRTSYRYRRTNEPETRDQ